MVKTEGDGSTVRSRILDAASARFYAEGIRAVSADKVIADAKISKVTFYRHFPSKDDLVVAYLERRASWERSAVEIARNAAPADPGKVFTRIAQAIGEESCSPGFRGCPFINAAAEYAEPDHPVRIAVDRHRSWFKSTIRDLLDESGIPESSDAADELVIVRDGAMVTGYLDDPGIVTRALLNAGRAVLMYHTATDKKAAL